MKSFLPFLFLIFSFSQMLAQGTQFEFEGSEGLNSKNIFVHGNSVYMSFTSNSQMIYHTYLAKWDLNTEKIEWCKKLSVDRNVSIHPVKIVAREDGTFVLGAYDYSWIDGFMNGNYTFIQFGSDGNIIKMKRLGSPNGGALRDVISDGDDLLFLGERINQLSQYRTVLGKMDKDFNVVRMRSVFKDFYTYGFALAKDKSGAIYTVGHTSPAFGLRQAFITKWFANLDHINSVIQLDDDPNTSFNIIHIDDKNEVHIGGTLGNLATYVHMSGLMEFKYGHEFNSGYPLNMWKDASGHTNLLIDGPDYVVRLDESNTVSYDAQYYSKGNITQHTYQSANNHMFSISSYNNMENPKNRLVLNAHTYALDKSCFLNSRPGDFNGLLRRDSFGFTNIFYGTETMTEKVPDDIIITDYILTAKEICRIDATSSTLDNAIEYLTCYPNPAQHLVNFNLNDNFEIYTLEVHNIQGYKVFAKSDFIPSNSLDISGFPAGFYFVRLTDKTGKTFLSKLNIIN